MSVGLFLVACGKTQPQRPNFRGESTVDTSTIQMLTLNQQMAAQADLQLAKVVGTDYVMMDENYWVKGLNQVQAQVPCLHEGDYIELCAQFYTLSDSLLTTHHATVQVGQVDEIQAIVDVLPQMQVGMHVSLLVPWYLAFGSAGNTQVPPFENLRVELEVKEK